MPRGLPPLLGTLISSLVLVASAGAAWQPMGLSGLEVRRLRSAGGDLYACTHAGLYRLASNAPDTTWTPAGFAGQEVLDLLVIPPGALLASRALSGAAQDTFSIHRSLDAGASWQPFQNGFGAGGGTFAHQARILLGPHVAGAPLFAVGTRIEKSTDGGMSWRVVSQISCALNALERSPADPAVFWAGGESVIFAPCVLRSTDVGETWKSQPIFAGGDNAVDAIAGHPTDANRAYVGMEGWVMKTEDGMTWSPLTSPDPSMYTFGMAVRPFGALKLYAAGARFAPDPRGVVFFQSLDGVSWDAIAYPAAGYGVHHLLLRTGGIEETLYVATGNGVYRHTQGAVDVERVIEPDRIQLTARPNPSGGPIDVEFTLPRAALVTVRVHDLRGRAVATLWSGRRESGVHRVRWDARDRPVGVYWVARRAGARTSWRKVSIVR